MTKMINVVLFTSHSIGFYPEALRKVAKTTPEIKMRTEIFPKYILEQEGVDKPAEEVQEIYDGLEVGESLRIGNRFYNSEMIAVRRFTVAEEMMPSIYIPKEKFKSMLPGDTIWEKGRKFYKDRNNEFVYVYEKSKSTAQLVEVDINRPWTIEEYDGAEYIEYLDYDVIDETYNFCKKKGE